VVDGATGPVGTSRALSVQPRGPLHEALNGRWALLAGPGNDDSVAAAENRLGENNIVVLTPVNGQLSDFLLIRPDAHLAWRGRLASAQLSRWLADALERGTAC
jgi:4,5-epoxidase